ncbi:MAG: hypothetical protein CMD65_01120 [Gammaproteobacteria bacterium]|nr:hypothetical protein [Gammaproteobacteria bacterium]|tara:strand:- start:471 stop:1697 length:1227 start_codon:yes stop_codon:yes gene_type:complete
MGTLIIFTILFYFLVKFFLDIIQIEYIKKVQIKSDELTMLNLNNDFIQKSNSYNTDKLFLSVINLFIQMFILVLFLFGGGIDYISNFVRSTSINFINFDLQIILIFFIIINIVNIPLSMYKTFIVEEKYGFNKMKISLFFKDRLISLIIALIPIIILFQSFLYLYDNYNNYWWLFTWLLFMIFNIFVILIYPSVISPLFNKFEKITDEKILNVIKDLSDETQFNVTDVFVMDGSKRSSHSNAYFTGLGNVKRIVFFDTLLEMLSANEIKSVLAHEIGHYKKKHITKSIIMSSIISMITFYLLYILMNTSSFFVSAGVTIITPASMIISFLLLFPLIEFFLTPLYTYISRKNEFEADNYAKEYTNKDDLVSSLLKLYKENLSILKPSPIYSKFYYTHPTVFERISNLKL